MELTLFSPHSLCCILKLFIHWVDPIWFSYLPSLFNVCSHVTLHSFLACGHNFLPSCSFLLELDTVQDFVFHSLHLLSTFADKFSDNELCWLQELFTPYFLCLSNSSKTKKLCLKAVCAKGKTLYYTFIQLKH